MNSLKNLVIIAVLGAAGYAIYVSLVRNNVEVASSQPSGESWTPGPKVEMPQPATNPVKTATGGSLTIGGQSQPMTAQANATSIPAAPQAPLLPYKSSTMSSKPSDSLLPQAGVLTPSVPPLSVDGSNTVGTAANSPFPEAALVRNIAPPPVNPSDGVLKSKCSAFMEAVQKKLDEGKFAEAHLALSTLYGNPDLPAEQSKQISELLDQLAGTVIYSRRHYLEPSYMAQAGDTLEKIAQRYSVPWQLLARINGLMPPGAGNGDSAVKDQPLPAGMELKVVRGPFEAIVNLQKHELVLMVQNRYAGRFAIGAGRDQPRLDGSYTVRDKTLNPTYYGPDNVTIGASDPRNPLGGAWIGLSDSIGIHGTNDPQNIGRDDNRGTICVGQGDVHDLYGILSIGSRVTVVR